MTRAIIRTMTPSDIPNCLAIVSECWGKATAQTARPEFEAMFANAVWRPLFYVAEQDDVIVGMAGYIASWLDYGIYEMFWHCVLPRARRQGIGESLVRRRLADLTPLADIVMIDTSAPAYYAKHFGFEFVASAPSAGSFGDHHIMMLKLK